MADASMTPESRALYETAQQTEQAARDALDWLRTPKNAERVGDDVDDKRRELHLGVKLARRIAKATERPMAVAVFGPSQAGKSHLIHTLSRREGRLLAHFDGMDPVNYITRINPEKQDRESTGLVTRFSVRDHATPPGFPVHLRLLEHADVIKIIANAYYLDGEPDKFEPVPGADQVQAHLDMFRAAKGAGANNGLDAADIWEIEAYAQDNLGHFDLVKALKASDFWSLAAEKVADLPIAELARFFAIFWGGHQALSDLYVKLVQALQRLDFASDAYAPFAAIDLDEPGVTSILDVDSLDHLVGDDTGTIVVRTEKGIEATLPRAVVTAITAELHIRMVDKPWDFFEHTDLLDFPGYRARGLATSETDANAARERSQLAFKLEDAPAQTIGALLRRGKVEYLFQRYVSEREITAMLLCVREGNFETKSLPQAIANWIGTTHGATPEDRVGKDTLLFFVLTRFDRHFEDTSTEQIARQLKGRIQESVHKAFGDSESSWVRNWANGVPFRNLFLMRKPAVSKQSVIYQIEGEIETGLTESGLVAGVDRLLGRMREAFLSLDDATKHFAEPARAFDELIKVDDGGASYLAEKLNLVCRPEIKPAQVRMNLETLRSQLLRLLNPAYLDSDLNERLNQRLAVAKGVIEDLGACFGANRIGSLVQGLMIDAGVMSDYLYRGEDADTNEEPALAPAGAGLGISLPGMPNVPAPSAPVARAPARSVYQKMAGIALKCWFDLLHERARNPAFCAETRMRSENLQELVEEFVQAARRQRLVDVIADQIKHHAYAVERRDLRREKAAMVAVRIINRFVFDFGLAERAESERPRLMSRATGAERVTYAQPPVAYDASGIQPLPKPYRAMLSEDWIYGFYQTVQDNARSVDGVDVDLVENERLGAILKELKAPVGQEQRQ